MSGTRALCYFVTAMTFETKTALYTALLLIAISAGSLVSLLFRADPVSASIQTPAAMRQVIVPVAGIAVAHLSDTWGTARRQGRRHEGIDIMAARGTPVHAAVGGTVAKLFKSGRGGITVYQFDPSKRFILYYAHLDRYAPGLKEGGQIAQGQVIAYVGSTGNATTPHLHFEIHRSGQQRQWWRGVSFNPFIALTSGQME